MSYYPVEIGDDEGVAEALNYLLSGPGGLGQNFSGFSAYYTSADGTPAYLTGNFRIPFTQSTPASLYVPSASIAVSNAEQLDSRTIKYTFASAQPAPPFALGNGLTITGITPATYNSDDLKAAGNSIAQIGVVECTTTYVIVRTVAAIVGSLGTYVSGGNIGFDSMNFACSTDCDVRVTVNGATDRVFIAAQLDQIIDYTVLAGSVDMSVFVDITRYKAFTNNDPTNPDYIFDEPTTISSKEYVYPGLTGTGTLPRIETVFTSVIDQPPPAYYRYIVEVYFKTAKPPQIEVTQDQLLLRSISAQVVKQ